MTRTLSMVSRKNYITSRVNTKEGFITFLTSKLITCFIGGFTLKMKPQSIAHLLNGIEHIYWIWTLRVKCTQYGICGLSGLQECKSNEFFKIGRMGINFRASPKNVFFLRTGGCPRPDLTPPKVRRGVLNDCLRPTGLLSWRTLESIENNINNFDSYFWIENPYIVCFVPRLIHLSYTNLENIELLACVIVSN